MLVGAGSYSLGSKTGTNYIINLPRSMSITGAGEATVTLKPADSLANNAAAISADGLDGIEIAHLTVDGNGTRSAITTAGNTAGEDEGINLADCTNSHLHDLTVTNCGQEAIDLDDCVGSVIEDVTLTDCWGNGVHGGGTVGASNVTVRNATVERCARGRGASVLVHAAAIHIAGANGLVEDCTLDDNYAGVLLTLNADNTTIRNVTFGPHDGPVIQVTDALVGITIENCVGLDNAGNPTTPFSHSSSGASFSVVRDAVTGELSLA